jgi:hypothetical protein
MCFQRYCSDGLCTLCQPGPAPCLVCGRKTYLQPCSGSTDVVCRTIISAVTLTELRTPTYHLPLTLIKQVIWGNSLGPSAKWLPNGSRISNRVESGEMAIFVSGTGAGDGDGAYDKSPGVNPAVGSRSPCGAVKRNDSTEMRHILL